MSKKTLPDELRSVLLSHSLDAPDPDSTVDQILAETIAAGSAAAGRADHTDRAGRAGRRPRRRPSGQLLVAAASVAVLVLAAAGVRAVSHGRSGQATTGSANSATQPAAGSAKQPLQRNTGGPQSAAGPDIELLKPPLPANLNCSSLPGGQATVGQRTTFRVSATGELRYVYEFLCVGTNGLRGPSEIQAFQLVNGQLRYLSTLIGADKGAHLEYLSGVTDGVTAQGIGGSDAPDTLPSGDVISLKLVSTDGGLSFSSDGAHLVAPACQRSDLTVTVRTVQPVSAVNGRAAVPAHRLLQLTNHTVKPCALEGYPNLVARSARATGGSPLGHTLSGPAGGLTSAAIPPIVVLIPGGTAGAILEYASVHPSCAPTDQLAVTLANGVSLGTVTAVLSACGLDVHPLVDNPFGSG
ncbi:MAG: DUF4232 domain-containing protein [Jatrophihabitans sp.]